MLPPKHRAKPHRNPKGVLENAVFLLSGVQPKAVRVMFAWIFIAKEADLIQYKNIS
ncbi:hypothetical protein H1R20_g14193, partial [Candolleomyces eurysporus]